jgi:hypothetical protein
MRFSDEGNQMTEIVKRSIATDFTAESNIADAIYSKLKQLCESKNHSTESPPRALISLQKSVVFGAMKQHGIQQLIVTYYVGGDSGDISDVSTGNSDTITQGDLSKIDIDAYPDISSQYDRESKQWVYIPEIKTTSLLSAVKDLTWEAIKVSGHSGWENCEGGGGTLTLDASKETVIVEQDYSYYEL